MSELAERVSKLRARTWTKIGFDTNDQDFTQRYDKLIEQALLAERRLAMEEAAKICDRWHKKPYAGFDGKRHWTASEQISAALRAAAEKEVVNEK